MHFRDYVGKLPHQWVLDNLATGADRSRRIVSSAMIKDAVVKFAARPALAKRFQALSPELRLKCARVYLTGGMALTEPAAQARSEPLLASLLVFAAGERHRVGGEEVRLFGFDEFEPALRPLMADALIEAGAAGECAPVAVCPWRPLNDIAALCSLASQGQLTRSVHGGLSRSALNALKRLTHDPTLTGRSVQDGDAGHPAGFLIGFCLGEGLIVDAGQEYRLNRQRFAAWLDKGMRERMRGLNEFAAVFLGSFGLGVLREMFSRAQGRWLSVGALVPESSRAALTRAIAVMEFLGCAHAGHSSGGARFAPCRIFDDDIDKLYAAEPKRGTVVMPDFTAVIPQEVSPSELFDFSKIGMLIAFDKVYRGQITKESVSNALSVGVEAERMREWLGECRAAANVSKTVDEWIREFSRLFVDRGAVLVSSDEKVTRQIASLEPLSKYLTKVSAHTVFMIRPGSEQKALDMLEKLGFDTRAPGSAADAADAAKREDSPVPAAASERQWEPLTDFSVASPAPRPANRTKYGAGLRELEPNEMAHVADYAILTGHAVVIDYAGSTNIKQGVYTVTPYGVDKGIDAAIVAEIPCVRGRKQFYFNKIKRMGVVTR